LMEL